MLRRPPPQRRKFPLVPRADATAADLTDEARVVERTKELLASIGAKVDTSFQKKK